MAYILYDELVWNDKHGHHHKCEKIKFNNFEDASKEMERRYSMHYSGNNLNNSSILLKYSALIIHYDGHGISDRMHMYGIMKEA